MIVSYQKIKSFKDLWSAIKKNNTDYVQRIRESGGANLYIRALTAQILWLLLIYSLLRALIPIKDLLISNALVFIILGLLSFIWNPLKDKLPAWINKAIKGELFYEFEIGFLNFWIGLLLVLNLLLLFLPKEFYKKLYQGIKSKV